MIIRFLKWLFREEWDDYIYRMEDSSRRHWRRLEEDAVAKRALKRLGYDLVFRGDAMTKKENDVPTLPDFGWHLVKINQVESPHKEI